MQGLAAFFQNWIVSPVLFTVSLVIAMVLMMIPFLLAAGGIGLVAWIGLWVVHWVGLPLPL